MLPEQLTIPLTPLWLHCWSASFPQAAHRWQTMEGIQTENQSSVEPALEFDGDRYNTFKCISREFCLGPMGACGQQFGLCHLVPDLARLCPDSTKQKELLATYNVSSMRNCSDDKKTKEIFMFREGQSKRNLQLMQIRKASVESNTVRQWDCS